MAVQRYGGVLWRYMVGYIEVHGGVAWCAMACSFGLVFLSMREGECWRCSGGVVEA